MVRIHQRLQTPAPAEAVLILSFDQRQKSRQRARLESGEEVGLNLPHGTVLRGGDQLRADDGRVIEVVAACGARLYGEDLGSGSTDPRGLSLGQQACRLADRRGLAALPGGPRAGRDGPITRPAINTGIPTV